LTHNAADAFGPLKSTAGAVVWIIDYLEVSINLYYLNVVKLSVHRGVRITPRSAITSNRQSAS
jgi:hypothetical protein